MCTIFFRQLQEKIELFDTRHVKSCATPDQEEPRDCPTSFWTQYKTLVQRNFIQNGRSAAAGPAIFKVSFTGAKASKQKRTDVWPFLKFGSGHSGWFLLSSKLRDCICNTWGTQACHLPGMQVPGCEKQARFMPQMNVSFQAVVFVCVIITLFWRLPRDEEDVESRRRLVCAESIPEVEGGDLNQQNMFTRTQFALANFHKESHPSAWSCVFPWQEFRFRTFVWSVLSSRIKIILWKDCCAVMLRCLLQVMFCTARRSHLGKVGQVTRSSYLFQILVMSLMSFFEVLVNFTVFSCGCFNSRLLMQSKSGHLNVVVLVSFSWSSSVSQILWSEGLSERNTCLEPIPCRPTIWRRSHPILHQFYCFLDWWFLAATFWRVWPSALETSLLSYLPFFLHQLWGRWDQNIQTRLSHHFPHIHSRVITWGSVLQALGTAIAICITDVRDLMQVLSLAFVLSNNTGKAKNGCVLLKTLFCESFLLFGLWRSNCSRAAGVTRQYFPPFIEWLRYLSTLGFGLDLLFQMDMTHGPPFKWDCACKCLRVCVCVFL